MISLDYLEHDIIRKTYEEPRVHFALVCVAKGCPELPDEPFVASKIKQQLDERTRLFLSEKDKNYIDEDNTTINLSQFIKRHTTDFKIHSGSIVEFVKIYFLMKYRKGFKKIIILNIKKMIGV